MSAKYDFIWEAILDLWKQQDYIFYHLCSEILMCFWHTFNNEKLSGQGSLYLHVLVYCLDSINHCRLLGSTNYKRCLMALHAMLSVHLCQSQSRQYVLRSDKRSVQGSAEEKKMVDVDGRIQTDLTGDLCEAQTILIHLNDFFSDTIK